MTTNTKKIFKWGLLSAFIIMITGGFVGYKMWNKPHRNVEEAKAITVTAGQLANGYETNEPESNSQYLDKILEVTGEVTEVSKNQKGEQVISLKGTDMAGIICTLEGTASAEIKPASKITLRGICTGFLTDVVLVRCKIKND
jgi:hypothetical protein